VAGGGQTGRGHGAGGGHFGAGGHITSGQRGLGHGGHSPHSFLQELLSMIIGCCFGILLFKTYLLRSAEGGHSVFNMYWLISGQEGGTGIVLLRTYLLRSGSLQGGQVGREFAPHGHGQVFLQFEQCAPEPLLVNPSFVAQPDQYPIKKIRATAIINENTFTRIGTSLL